MLAVSAVMGLVCIHQIAGVREVSIIAMIKRFMLAISRIGGYNERDEELFGRGPSGRMANYLIEYIEKNANR